ncbi:hypothetical protein M513_12573 [Trichuris suis]|uniref:Uncharacterized protein n=1 Tax=Trichuris suis TaxID=68888 RepID=A0A085LNK9_9BILA|nr:hypothetical protein M513_12573 [Trichuris suis]
MKVDKTPEGKSSFGLVVVPPSGRNPLVDVAGKEQKNLRTGCHGAGGDVSSVRAELRVRVVVWWLSEHREINVGVYVWLSARL